MKYVTSDCPTVRLVYSTDKSKHTRLAKTEIREIGTVKQFDTTKGFGFIKPDGRKNDIFVHHSGVIGKCRPSGHRRKT
jgi:hypothetical protein